MKKKSLPKQLAVGDAFGTFRSNDGALVLELVKNSSYSLAYGELLPGEKTKNHRMQMQECYIVIEGTGELVCNNSKQKLGEGDIVIVNKNTEQSLRNTGKKRLKFYMLVNPPYDPEKEEILED